MKASANVNPRTLDEAVKALNQPGKTTAIVGGGSDLLGMVKEHLISPEVLVNLKTIRGLDQIVENKDGVKIGGLVSLTHVSEHPLIRSRYKVLADAAHAVGTPQIRNAGTIAGNVCQRPWCWYLRNSFPCYKNGGNTCFSVVGENEFHAIFGGGPSYIVHPSDTAPALVALDAKFRIAESHRQALRARRGLIIRGMKFAAVIEYHPDTSKVSAARPPHRVYLAEMKKAGKLVVAGPFADMTGGLIVYEAENAEEAEKFIRDDPFFAHGIFQSWTIRPWVVVMTNREMLPENPPT